MKKNNDISKEKKEQKKKDVQEGNKWLAAHSY